MATPREEEMDTQAAEAAKELATLGADRIVDISRWWNRWYLKAGHRRLGRIVRDFSPAQTNAKAVSSKKQPPNPSAGAVTTDSGIEYRFQNKAMDTARFVAARFSGAIVNVDLNTNHPIHKYLSLAASPTNSVKEGETDLAEAKKGLQTLLKAWAAYELSEPAGPRKDRARRAAIDWGRAARRLLQD